MPGDKRNSKDSNNSGKGRDQGRRGSKDSGRKSDVKDIIKNKLLPLVPFFGFGKNKDTHPEHRPDTKRKTFDYRNEPRRNSKDQPGGAPRGKGLFGSRGLDNVDLIKRPQVKRISNQKGKLKEDDVIECDPEDDVWELDQGKPSQNRKYARSVIEAFHPVMIISTIAGLFPLMAHRGKSGVYTCKFTWCSYPAIFFLLMSLIIISFTCWMLVSIVCITVNSPKHPDHGGKTRDIYRSEEIFVYKRNIVALVIMICSSIHLTVCMIAVFYRRDYIAKQVVYWTEVVELLHLDVGKDVAKSLWIHMGVGVAFATALTVLFFIKLTPGLHGASSMLYIIQVRVIDPLCLWHKDMYFRRLGFGAFMLFMILAGNMYILWFFYNCRILTNILKIWNNRFEYCLHKHILEMSSIAANTETRRGVNESDRTSRGALFKDHIVIFNLLEGVNAQFEVIMESYYFSTMIMIVFECYGFVRTFHYSEFISCGSRAADIIPVSLFLAMHLYMYITITLEAANVADEARHVLDIVRRKGMMTSRADAELWFMMSMRLSFGGHEDVGIIGAGFFYVTKAFLLGGISAIMSHFIIFYQFEIPLSQTEIGDENFKNLSIPLLLEQLENVRGTTC